MIPLLLDQVSNNNSRSAHGNRPQSRDRKSQQREQHSRDLAPESSDIADLVNLDVKDNVDKIVAKVLQLDSKYAFVS